DLERLLARVGLGNQEVLDLDAELAGIAGIEGVFGIDEGAGAALLLGLGHDMERQRRLARALRAINLRDPPAGQSTDAKGDVEAERAGRDRLGFDGVLVLAEAHDGALAEGPFDLAESGVQ